MSKTARTTVAHTAHELREEAVNQGLWGSGVKYAADVFEARIDDTEEVKGVFNTDIPCPDCDRQTIFGYSFFNQDGKHQHTHYVCTYWPSDGVNRTKRCGWHGWTVPQVKKDFYRLKFEVQNLVLYSETIETTQTGKALADKYWQVPGIVAVEKYNEDTCKWVVV